MGMMQQMFAGFLTTAGSPIVVTTDSLFNYVSLLLNGETTLPLYNTDASTNNFLVSPNGAVRSDVFTPFRSGNYSVAFGGTSYITTPPNSVFNVGANNFTMEAWIYLTSTQVTRTLFGQADAASGNGSCMVWLNGSGFPAFYSTTGGTTSSRFDMAGTTTPAINMWHHLVVCRSGSTISMFMDGTRVATGTNGTTIFTDAAHNFHVAADSNGANAFIGSISNLRFVIGTSVYDPTQTTITVPTSALTAITNTVILACAAPSIKDIGPNNLTLTGITSPKVLPAVPFTYSNAYGSAYLNGSTDYLVTPANTSLAFGTGDFTVETWVYFNSVAGTYVPFCQSDIIGGTSTNDKWFFALHSSTLNFGTHNGGGYNASIPWAPTTNQWYHVAAVRLSGTTQLYINGVAGTMTGAASGSGYTLNQNGVSIGTMTTPFYFSGYLSNTRLVKGTAVYTSAFTPPTAPLAAITNTSLLTLQGPNSNNNNTVMDSSSNNFALARTGTPTQGTFSPFSQSGWSGYFNGTTDYLTSASSAAYTFGTADFTVEGWVYMTSFNTVANGVFQQGTSNFPTSVANSVAFGTGSTTTWQVYAKNAAATTSGVTAVAPVLNQWTHFAVVRASSVTTLYINGVVGLAVTADTTNYTGTFFGIGSIYGTPAGDLFPGYISNVRVVKGTAVYTSAFTPPTAPLTAITGTSLLTLQSARFVDNSTNKFAITTSGTPSTQATSPFEPSTSYSPTTNGGSIYFAGGTDGLTVPASTNWVFSGDYTIEAWVYPTAGTSGAYQQVFGTGGAGSNDQFAYTVGSGNAAILWNYAGAGNTNLTSIATIPVNTWTHIAVARSGTTLKAFVSGVQMYSGTQSGSIGTNAIAYMGRRSDGSSVATAYMSNIRVVNGTAVYTSAFTTPTAPLSAITNTSLLLNATNGGVINASSKTNISTVGSVQATTALYKYGSRSLKFNGTSDYLSMPVVQTTQLGSNNFTYELWVNASTIGAQQSLAYLNGNTSGYAALSANILANGKLACSISESGAAWKINDTTGLGTALSANTWYHIAVVRNGATVTVYLNGSSIGTYTLTASTTSLMTTYTLNQIGVYNTTINFMNGYIDELRTTVGVARYTGAFTPPTSSFPTN